MNELLLTYQDLKRLHSDDKLNTLSVKRLEKLTRALRCWYCNTDFDQVTKITGINPMDGNDEDNSRNKMIDQASKVWNSMGVSEQLTHFIDLCDDAEELVKYIDE